MSELEELLLFQIRAAKLPEPLTEYPFAKAIGRRFRFDLCWLDRKVAAEVDGGIWVAGRHSRGSGIERDAEKMSIAAVMGFRVLRFTAAMIQDGRALTLLEQALADEVAS